MLSLRLEALLGLIKQSKVLADVGCDHGKLACEAFKRQLAIKVYAMDVNDKPLKQALKTIEDYGLQGKVIPILSDGFKAMPSDTDTALIAGMGFETCRSILEADISKTRRLNQIIIQVNRDVAKLRRWAMRNQFEIVNELVIHDDHYYQMLVLKPGEKVHYSEIELDLGPVLIKRKDEVTLAYLRHLLHKYQQTLTKITNDHVKKGMMEKAINQIESILENNQR